MTSHCRLHRILDVSYLHYFDAIKPETAIICEPLTFPTRLCAPKAKAKYIPFTETVYMDNVTFSVHALLPSNEKDCCRRIRSKFVHVADSITSPFHVCQTQLPTCANDTLPVSHAVAVKRRATDPSVVGLTAKCVGILCIAFHFCIPRTKGSISS